MQDYGHEFAEFLYYIPDSLDKEGVFWLLRAGKMIAKSGYFAGPKRIKSYSMHFVMKGSVTLEYGRERLELTEGDIFCLYPMQSYVYREIKSDHKLEMCWLNMDGPGVEPMLRRSGFTSSMPFVKNGWTQALQRTIDSLLERMRSDCLVTPSLRLEIQSLLYQLFSQLLQENSEELKTEPVDWIKRCIKYIEANAMTGVSVQQVAEWAGVSRTYFSTIFTSQTGMAPSMYISKIRMDKAMRMLVDTNHSITDIALTLGYPSLYSFTRAFKNRFSLSPTEFRNT
ncbi:helix-turn-helix domain-containing protein [Paenibacillus sp. GCM10028914]|uniref:helix-turn-helix domain-containing protein n=1 Tax=Paenibacillus sp. GCM10028914 TaxID=3273416 RepID=UPI003614E149